MSYKKGIKKDTLPLAFPSRKSGLKLLCLSSVLEGAVLTSGTITRRSLLSLLCFSPILYAQTLDKERVWQDFLDWHWLKTGSVSQTSSCFGMLKEYRAKLAADGIRATQMDWRMSVINQFYLSRKALWDGPDLVEVPAKTADQPRFLVIGAIADIHWAAVITYQDSNI